MKKRVFILVLIMIFVVLFGIQCSTQPEAEPMDAATPEMSPVGLMNDKCSGCHGVGVVRATDRTEQDWIEVVDRMIRKGADMDEEEREIIIDYLLENYKK